jgi:hypothetical protein
VDFEIVLYAVPLGSANYPRPCVVIDDGAFQMMALTTKPYDQFNSFTIPVEHPDFSATGLSARSYVIGAPIIQGERTRVLKRIGKVSGELGRAFAAWIG